MREYVFNNYFVISFHLIIIHILFNKIYNNNNNYYYYYKYSYYYYFLNSSLMEYNSLSNSYQY